MSRRLLGLIAFLAATVLCNPAAAARRPLVIDTDVGTDDLIAIALLLSRPDVHIEAITIANGRDMEVGARTVLRLLALARRADIPVYLGRATPLQGNATFPSAWRDLMAKLPGVDLPRATRLPNRRSAGSFLTERLTDDRTPIEVLALGPLTNLAESFARSPEAAKRVKSIVIMGGAIHVPGNLRIAWPDAGDAAEFNIFVDPEGARQVFASGAPVLVVPLDATNYVPIDESFVADVRAHAATPLGKFVVQILDLRRDFIASGTYFAWDPAAAAILLDPSIATTAEADLSVDTTGANIGRLRSTTRSSRTRVASRIDPAAFRRIFLSSVASAKRNPG